MQQLHDRQVFGLLMPLLLAAVTAALIAFYLQTQPMLSKAGGAGWEGIDYARVADQIASGEVPHAAQPVIYRLGTPLSAAALKWLGLADSTVLAFRTINLSFGFLNVLLIYALVTWFAGRLWGFSVGVLYAAHWVSPLRLIVFSPVLTDAGALFFLYLGFALLLLFRDRAVLASLAVAATVFLGSLFREFALFLPMGAIVAGMMAVPPGRWRAPEGRRRLLSATMPGLLGLLAGVSGLLLVRFLVDVETEQAESYANYTFFSAALFHFWINSPQFFLQALFTTFGLFLLFPALQWRALRAYATDNPLPFAMLVVLLPMAYIGGYDVERYLNWAFPFGWILIIQALRQERLSWPVIVLLLIFALVFVCRLPWPIPDYRSGAVSPFPIFTYLTGDFRFHDLYVIHSEKLASGKIFYEYLLASAVLVCILRREQLRNRFRQILGRA